MVLELYLPSLFPLVCAVFLGLVLLETHLVVRTIVEYDWVTFMQMLKHRPLIIFWTSLPNITNMVCYGSLGYAFQPVMPTIFYISIFIDAHQFM